MRLDLTIPDNTSAVVLSLAGIVILTEADARQFWQAVDDALEQNRVHLVVDLSGTRLLNTTGIGLLVSGLRKTRARGGDLRLCGAAGAISHILTVTDLIKVFKTYETAAAAAESFLTTL